jgi:ribosomal protein S18 acetylase RimI-like enzyme
MRSIRGWIDGLLCDLEVSPALRDHGVGQRLLVNNVRAMTRDEATTLYASIW